MPRHSQRGRALAVTGELLHCHWRDLAEHVRRTVGQVDALIVDAPYSERTHKGHDDGTATANRVAEWAARGGKKKRRRTECVVKLARLHGTERRSLKYAPWDASTVAEFVGAWAPLCGGWFVSLTDHVLAPAWEASMEAAGRYAFAPIAFTEIGSRVRMAGDGPSNWSCWVVVSRPKDGAWLESWRASRRARGADRSLPGSYVAGDGVTVSDSQSRLVTNRTDGVRVVGGKPLTLMSRIVDDYSEPGDLVCDPCMGAGTTLLAAKLLGRQYIGGDLDAKHVEIARERLRDLPAQPKSGTLALPWEKP